MQDNEEDPQRQEIIAQALHARTIEEIEIAICRLNEWMRNHPEDESMRDAYEPLVLRQMVSASKPAQEMMTTGR